MADTPSIPPNGGNITPSGRDEDVPVMDTTFQYSEERPNLAVRGKVLARNQKSLQHNFAQSEEKCDVSFQKLQNASSYKIEDARWNQQRDTRICFDLCRLKATMSSWAGSYSIDSMANLQTLVEETSQEAALLEKLSSIVHMEDNGLPACLDTPNAPATLLNALLAHDVYQIIFENPFWFICDKLERNPQGLTTDTKLTGVHKLMLAANEPKAHVWRSDTLRLLRPQNRKDTSKAELVLRNRTDAQILQMSEWYAEEFLKGPACHFVRDDAHVEYVARIKEIYVTAAEIAYEIWSMRTKLKFLTLEDIDKGGIDLNSSHVELAQERSVLCEQDEGEMFGQQITVLIHPLVLGYETEEKKKKKHNEVVVWAKAVVWVEDKALRNEPLL